MRVAVPIVIVVLLAGTARADDRERRILFSAPLVLGYDNLRDAFVWGARPELLVAWDRIDDDGFDHLGTAGFGFGLYGEVDRVAGDTALGAGGTFMRYRHGWGYGPSVGVYEVGDEDGVSVSLFFGARDLFVLEHTDLPFGFRIEGRFGNEPVMGDVQTLMLTADLDLPVGLALAAEAIGSIGGGE